MDDRPCSDLRQVAITSGDCESIDDSARLLRSFVAIFTARLGSRGAETIPVPDSIRAEGVPPMPAAVRQCSIAIRTSARPASRTGTTPRRGPSTSPPGSPTRRRSITSPVPARRGGSSPSSADRVLGVLGPARARPVPLFDADEGGAENYQLFLQDRTGGEPRRITDGKSRNTSPSWSPSGELLAWSSNARNGRDMDLYVAAPADPHFRRRLKDVSGRLDRRRLVARRAEGRGRRVPLDQRVLRPPHRRRDRRDPDDHAPRTDPTAGRPSPYGDARWSQGRQVALLDDRQRRASSAASPGTTWPRPPTSLTADIPWDVEELDLSDDGTPDRPRRQRGRLRAASTSSTPRPAASAALPTLPGRAGHGPGRSAPGSHEFGFTSSSARSPSDVYSLRPRTAGQLERWTESETGGLDPATFAEPELIRYPTLRRPRRSRRSSIAPPPDRSPARARS